MTSSIVFWKYYKIAYGFLKPLIRLAIIVDAILCCFPSSGEGNARTIAIALLVALLVIMLLLDCIDKRKRTLDQNYRMCSPKILRKLDPETTVPLLALSVLVAVPFYILLISSVKTYREAANLTFTWWPQEGIDLGGYLEVFELGSVWGVSIGTALINSFVYAIIPTVLGVFMASIAAYSFAKLRFKHSATMYFALIMTMMMPECVTMTTSYLLYDLVGWTGGPLPLVIPGCFGGAATVLFLREYYMGIPDGLLEAAQIDGAGKWKRYLLIALPMAKPALMAQFVLQFITRYNNFLTPLIYLDDPKAYTIQILLNFLIGSSIDTRQIAAAGMCTVIPMLLLYVIFQKKILSGISMSSGLKG